MVAHRLGNENGLMRLVWLLRGDRHYQDYALISRHDYGRRSVLTAFHLAAVVLVFPQVLVANNQALDRRGPRHLGLVVVNEAWVGFRSLKQLV